MRILQKIIIEIGIELCQVKQKQRTSKNNTRNTSFDIISETCEKQFNFA